MRGKTITKLIGLALVLAVACILFVSPWFNIGAPSSQHVQSSSVAPSSLVQPSSLPSASVSTSLPASSSVAESSASELYSDIMLSDIILEVENILQYPELPNGCEATSLAIALNYLGFAADKIDLSENYIPTLPLVWENGVCTGGDPEKAYIGNAAGNGYYCYTAPVATAANSFLVENNSGLRAKQHNGIDEDGLMALLSASTPVIVWKTIDNLPPRGSSDFNWMLPNDEGKYNPLVNLHVAVLIGYDAENFYFCDPLEISPSMPRENFMDIFEQMGSRAVAIG